ncbi:MAG: hypothetical protein AAF170_02395 [Bacteroidota bacterium]
MSVVRFGMRAAWILVALLGSACGTAEAVVEPPTPLPLSSAAVPSVPPPPPLPEVPPAPPPLDLPPTPRGAILSQSVFPLLDVTQWTLANGAVVVYKHLPDAEGYVLRAIAKGGWTTLSPRDSVEVDQPLVRRWEAEGLTATLAATERRIDAQGPDLEVLIGGLSRVFAGDLSPARARYTAVDRLDPIWRDGEEGAGLPIPLAALFSDPGAFTVVVVGADDPEVAASVAGRRLALVQASDGISFGDPVRFDGTAPRVEGAGDYGVLDVALRISSRAGDEAPLQVLRGALEASLRTADLGSLTVEAARVPWTESAWLRVLVEESAMGADGLETAIREALSGDALYVSRARRRLLRDLRSPTPRHWLDAVTQLYRDGGGRQPGYDPASLSPLSAPLTRVTDSDVLTLARRFAGSTDTAMILSP